MSTALLPWAVLWATCGLLWLPASLPAQGPAQGGQTANERILQIRRLGKTDSQAIPELAKSLSDPNPDIRLEAVRAIVKIGSERSLDPLVEATHDNDPDVEILATNGIVNFYLPGYVSSGLLSHPLSRGVKQFKALFAVRNRQEIAPEITVRPNIREAIAVQVEHAPSVDARANAARAAGILHDGAAVPALGEALRSREKELILESLYAMQKIGDPAAGPSAGFLLHDLDDKVELAALETVGVLRSTASEADVRQVFDNARNEKVRRAALEALAVFGTPGDRTLFQQHAADSDAVMRAAALEGLGRLREPEDTPLLDAAYNEKDIDWRVHLAAAFALVSEGKMDASEFSPLQYLVENLDQVNRDSTAQAYLTELCRRDDVRKGVYTLLPQASVAQKVALCNILAASHAPDVIPVLTDLAKDANPDLSLAASKSLRIAQARRP
jgi:HEAT repeat protein